MRGDQSIVRVTGGIAALGQRGFIAGLLQFQFDDASSFVLALHAHSLRFQRRLDRHRLHGAQKFPGQSSLDTGTAKRHATGLTQHKVGTIATVDPLSRRAAGITHRQSATATPAGEETGQKRPSAPARLGTADPTVSIGSELFLVPFELGPVNIALMMLFNHDLPLVERLAMAVGL